MLGRKAKFSGKMTKWEIKRAKRPAKRIRQGKKPLAEPLVIAPVEERQAALKQRKMVFYDGNRRIEIPLVISTVFGSGSLQGLYKRSNGSIVTLRSLDNFPSPLCPRAICFFELSRDFTENIITTDSWNLNFAFRQNDLGHALVKEQMRGEGLGVKAVAKADMEQRAKSRGTHSFYRLNMFEKLFEKLNYRVVDGNLIRKHGKYSEKNDLGKWHRVEAVDPKDGKSGFSLFL